MKFDLQNALEVKILKQSPKLQRFIKLLTSNKEMKFALFIDHYSLDRKTTHGFSYLNRGLALKTLIFPKCVSHFDTIRQFPFMLG